jgi:hypothetical protein
MSNVKAIGQSVLELSSGKEIQDGCYGDHIGCQTGPKIDLDLNGIKLCLHIISCYGGRIGYQTGLKIDLDLNCIKFCPHIKFKANLSMCSEVIIQKQNPRWLLWWSYRNPDQAPTLNF